MHLHANVPFWQWPLWQRSGGAMLVASTSAAAVAALNWETFEDLAESIVTDGERADLITAKPLRAIFAFYKLLEDDLGGSIMRPWVVSPCAPDRRRPDKSAASTW